MTIENSPRATSAVPARSRPGRPTPWRRAAYQPVATLVAVVTSASSRTAGSTGNTGAERRRAARCHPAAVHRRRPGRRAGRRRVGQPAGDGGPVSPCRGALVRRWRWAWPTTASPAGPRPTSTARSDRPAPGGGCPPSAPPSCSAPPASSSAPPCSVPRPSDVSTTTALTAAAVLTLAVTGIRPRASIEPARHHSERIQHEGRHVAPNNC